MSLMNIKQTVERANASGVRVGTFAVLRQAK